MASKGVAITMAVVDAKLDQLAKKIDGLETVYEVVAQPGDTNHKGESEGGYLGRGTYGVVKRMRKISGGEPVAVKQIQKHKLRTAKQLQHTLVEVAVMKTLKHPGCLRLHDVLHTSDSLYLVTTLCHGELFDFIQSRRIIEPTTAAIILKQVVEALAYLHSVGVVHRDVKPENILINPDSLSIKLIDFGLAKFIGQKQQQRAPTGNVFPPSGTQQQQTLNPSHPNVAESPGVLVTPFTCTEYYASLETIEAMIGNVCDGRPAWRTSRKDLPKVDVYGAGVVAYAMLIGRLPYLTRSTLARKQEPTDDRLKEIRRLMMGGIQFPPTAAALPTDALECIRRMMDHNARTRPSAVEVLTFPWLAAVTVPTQPATPGPAQQPPQPPPQKENVIAQATVVPVKDKPGVGVAPPPRRKGKKGQHGAASQAVSPAEPPTASNVEPSSSTAPKPPAETAQDEAPDKPSTSTSPEGLVFTASCSEAPSTADPSNFKDGWGSIMRNLREGEDSDVEEKDPGQQERRSED